MGIRASTILLYSLSTRCLFCSMSRVPLPFVSGKFEELDVDGDGLLSAEELLHFGEVKIYMNISSLLARVLV